MAEIDTRLKRLPKSLWRGVKDDAHALQDRLARLWGRPGAGMRTDLRQDGRPVLFIHNPKAGGTSLGRFLHVKRRSHAFPADRLNESAWRDSFVIAVVRNPFDRFLSGYYDHIGKGEPNGLVKMYGEAVWSLGLMGYLQLLRENPKYGGPQTHWTHYPSATKPAADLILRFEEIGRWKDILLDRGLAVGDRTLPAANRGLRSDKPHLERLGIDRPAFDAAMAAVRVHFAQDFETFGYPDTPPDPT